jgi:hypothetical protein
MAHKRRIVVERKETPVEKEPEPLGWRDWLLRRYARYWYGVVMMFIDIVIFLELPRSMGTGYLVSGMATVGAGAVQLALYFRIWGRGAPLGEKLDENDR